MGSLKMKLQFLLLFTISLTSACKQDDAVKLNEQTKHVHKTGSAIVGKPQAPVNLNYEFVNTPMLDETLDILLKLSVESDTEILQANYTSSSSLLANDATQSQIFSNVRKGKSVSYTIQVIPKQPDLSYVNVFVSTIVNGKKQSRAFAIPVSIDQSMPSSVILKSKPQSLPLPEGFEYNQQQNIVIMPAAEPH